MSVLQVSDLRFGYGGDLLFEKVTFRLEKGERAALVAPNGAGKSTLLRLVAGELAPDQGSSVVAKGVSFGYYRQSHEVGSEGDVMGAFLSGFHEIVRVRNELAAAHDAVASGEPDALSRLAHLQDTYHLLSGDSLEARVSMLAHKLGFSDADMKRPIASLSGGERGRLTLGVVLAREPDLLLLDEPTNHLDLDTIQWLEGHLAGYRGAVLVVSHDRAFLDAVCPRTFELGTRGLRVYEARYSEYAILREEELQRERALASRQADFVAKTEDFIRKNIAGQKTKQAQSRRKMLDKLDRLENPEDVWQVAEKVRFRFADAPRSGDIVLEAKGLSAARGGRTLFADVSLLVRRGERIGIVGPNGAGKTTLLRLLAGRGDPSDGGSTRRGTNLAEGYYDQHLGEVNPALTAVDEVRRIRGDFTVEAARQYLARFRFWGDDPLRVVQGFSGGERARLALAKLLLDPKNLLFLDEPTNHLDIPAAEILEEALSSFEGTLLLVSHDRRFLEAVTTRIVFVSHGTVDIFGGGFRDFLGSRAPKKEADRKEGPPKTTGTDDKKQRYEDQKREGRALEKKKKRVSELEGLIAKAETDLERMRTELRAGSGDDWEALAKLAEKEQALAKNLDHMMNEWAILSEEVAVLSGAP